MKLAFNVRFIALGFLVYIIFLILNFPADRAYAYWKSSDSSSSNTSSSFALTGISGSVWSGKANVAAIKGTRFENVEWTLRPWVLLFGEVGLSWRFRDSDSQGSRKGSYGQGVTSLGLDGSISFSSLEAQVPVSMVASMANMKALQPSGSISLNLQDVEWNGESLVSAEGRVIWRGAGVNLLKPVSLGDLTLTLETSNDEVKGVIADSGGPLSAEGLITVEEDGRYQFNGAFAARNDKGLENALRSMGRPGADGKVKINYSGNLVKLGLVPVRPSARSKK
ncbi:MAG: type II secretion system protein N [Gammaproteobacteria bacterium]|nr:type II secretion system protein N [Gammaproteobacteria bacterium]